MRGTETPDKSVCRRTSQELVTGTSPRSFHSPFWLVVFDPPLVGICHSSTAGPLPSSYSIYTLLSTKVKFLVESALARPRYVRSGFNSFTIRLD
jgi:hypothetical protein